MSDGGISISLDKKTLGMIVTAIAGIAGSGTLGTLLNKATSEVAQVQQAIPVMVRGAEVCRVELKVTQEALDTAREAAFRLLDRCVP